MFNLIKQVFATTNVALQVHEIEVAEKATRKFGKLEAKLMDESIKRSTYKKLKKLVK